MVVSLDDACHPPPDLLQVLVEYGADRAALNKEGKKPIDVAKNPETRAILGA